MTDAEWAVALARAAAAAFFVARARPQNDSGGTRADPGRPRPVESGSRESVLAQPTVR